MKTGGGVEQPGEHAKSKRVFIKLLRGDFQNVKVTGRSGDGGIDGEGILEINPLLSFKVLFLCKRYQGFVGASMIRDFR